MKIQFANDEIKEFSVGHHHYTNTGEPFDVPPAAATGFLTAKHFLDGEFVHVFEPADVDVSEGSSDTVESLVKAHSREELETMAKELGLDGNAHTNKTELATAILAAKGDK